MRPTAGNAALRPDQKQQPLRLVARHADLGGARLASSTRRISAISAATSSRRAVGLDEQDRGGVERIVRVHELLDRARGRLVHHLEARRDDARADDRADRRARLLDVVERGERHLRELRLRQRA